MKRIFFIKKNILAELKSLGETHMSQSRRKILSQAIQDTISHTSELNPHLSRRSYAGLLVKAALNGEHAQYLPEDTTPSDLLVQLVCHESHEVRLEALLGMLECARDAGTVNSLLRYCL